MTTIIHAVALGVRVLLEREKEREEAIRDQVLRVGGEPERRRLADLEVSIETIDRALES